MMTIGEQKGPRLLRAAAGRMAWTARGIAAALATLALLAGMPAHSAGASTAPPSWNQYLFPGPVSYSCSTDTTIASVTIRETQELQARYRTKLGTHYMVRYQVALNNGSQPPSGGTLTYLVTPTGRVHAIGFQSSTGLDVTEGNAVVYPSIPQILHGARADTHTVIRIAASSPTTQAAFEKALGVKALRASVVFAVTGVPPQPVTTPAGTFTNTVTVVLTVAKLHFLDHALTKKQRRSLAGFLPRTTMVFAKGVGLVRTSEAAPGLGHATVRSELVGCRGLAGIDPPPPLSSKVPA